MSIGWKKIVLTIILNIIFVIAFGWIIMMLNHSTLVKNQAGDDTLKLEEVTYTLEDIQSNWNTMEQRIRDRYEVDATLSAFALRNIIAEKGDRAISLYSNGAVIKVLDGKITAPEGIDQKLGLTAEQFADREGLFSSPEEETTLVVYSLISDSYYYVEWHEDTSFTAEVEEAADIPGILQKTEAAYDVYALCVAEDPDGENGRRILYSNVIFTDLEEIFSETERSDISVEQAEEDKPYESGTLSLANGTFRYAKCAVPEVNGYLILLTIQPNLYVKALSQGTYMFSTLIIFLAALITAGFSLYFYIQKNNLPPYLEQRYKPSNVRRFASLCGVIGAILIFLSGMMIYALNDLYDNTAKGKERLRMLEESLSMYDDRVKMNMEHFIDIYLDYGSHIAECLDNYPELRERGGLDTLADSISASSITLYDADGNETVSSGDYTGLTLGSEPKSATYDFRRLLRGVPSVVHGQEVDETTGLSEIRMGLRIQDTADPGKYGAMIISVDPTLWNFDLLEMTQSVLQNLSGPDTILFIVSPTTGKILSSNNESLIGRDISVLGLNETHLRGSLVKNTETDEGSWFVTSAVFMLDTSKISDRGGNSNRVGYSSSGSGASGSSDGGDGSSGSSANSGSGSGGSGIGQAPEEIIAYYAGARLSPLKGMLISSLVGCALFLLIYAVSCWLVLGSYTDEYYEQNKGQKVSSVKEMSSKKDTNGWSGIWDYLSSIRPEKTGLITMEFIVGLYLIQQIPVASFKDTVSRNSVYYYITSGSWERGLNLFALAGILHLLGQILLVVILIRLLLAACATFSGSKGKTICRLIRSLTMYVALFAFLIIACTYIGISMAVILTAFGTLGIAVSLGAQHFVSDIIAGLTIVFEGTCHVGDIVDVGVGAKAYHGEVKEIGLRFIKLQTGDDGIVTLSNRDINMVNNMTHE